MRRIYDREIRKTLEDIQRIYDREIRKALEDIQRRIEDLESGAGKTKRVLRQVVLAGASLTPAAAPIDLVVVLTTEGVMLSWARTPGALFYNVYVAGTNDFTQSVLLSPTIDNQFLHRSPPPGVYWYWVTSVSAHGESVPSKPVMVEITAQGAGGGGGGGGAGGTGPPPAPANLIVYDVTESSVTLMWDDVPISPRTFTVFRNDQAPEFYHEWTNAVGVGIVSPIFEDRRVQSGKTYHYWVVTIDELGRRSAPTGPVSVTVQELSLDTTPPAAPQNLRVELVTSEGVLLAWDPVSDADLAKYIVYRQGIPIGESIKGINTYFDRGAPRGVTVDYIVRAVDYAGNLSAPSNQIYVTVPTEDGSIPVVTGFRLAALSHTGVKLEWNPVSLSTFSHYVIRRVAEDGAERTYTTKETYLWDRNVVPYASYSYFLHVVDRDGNQGPPAGPVLAEIPAPPPPSDPPPDPPSGLQAAVQTAADGSYYVALSWTAPPDPDVAFYLVYRCQGGPCNYPNQIGRTTTTSLDDYSVADGQTYAYYVRAVDKVANNSALAGPVVADVPVRMPTTGSPPPAPIGLWLVELVHIPGTDLYDVKIGWKAVGGADGYYVYRRTSAGSIGTEDRLAWTAGVAYIDTRQPPGDWYYYVTAVDADTYLESSPAGPLRVSIAPPKQPDTTPPDPPPSVKIASTRPHEVRISWQPSPSEDVAMYHVYVGLSDAFHQASGPSPMLNTETEARIVDARFEGGTTVYAWVAAVDFAGNISTPTGPASVTIPYQTTTPDPAPPGASGLEVMEVKAHLVAVRVVGYTDEPWRWRLYRATTNDFTQAKPVKDWPMEIIIDDTAVPGMRYWYWVVAVSEYGRESVPAGPVEVETPPAGDPGDALPIAIDPSLGIIGL